MRILQISPYFHPYVGGQEKYVYELTRKLVEHGHEVTVYTSNFPKNKVFEVINGLKVHRFKLISRPLRNPITPNLLYPLIKGMKNFDIVHVHNEHGFTTLLATLVKNLEGKNPLIVSCHGQLMFNNPLKDLIERAYSRSIGVMIFKSAEAIIALSSSDKKYIYSLGIDQDKVKVIPNAVDLNRLSVFKGRSKLTLLKKFNLEGKRVVLFVGPIIKRKGVDTLLSVIPRVVQDQNDVVFVFTGDGDFINKARELARLLRIEKHIRFTRRLTETELYEAYQLSELVVLPSISEGVPTTILEAFAFSKPVVSTKIAGILEHFSEAAFLISPKSVSELSSAIKVILENEKLANYLGEKGRELVEKHFTWEIVTTKILRVYEEVLN